MAQGYVGLYGILYIVVFWLDQVSLVNVIWDNGMYYCSNNKFMLSYHSHSSPPIS